MAALRIFLLSGLVLVCACSSEPVEPSDACTEAFCECEQTTDCAAGLVCTQGLCLPVSPDITEDTSAPDTTEDIVPDIEDVPSVPDTQQTDIIEEVVEDACVRFCESRVACGLEPIPGITGDCPTACEVFAAAIVEGTQGAVNPEACNLAFTAFSNCVAEITDCAELEAGDRGESTVCAAEEEARGRDCTGPEEETPDDGSAAPDEGSASPDEGSASPDEGSASSGSGK
ncbi:MAG: hypothetical protein KGO50_03375 [Myxococcales bacterium]|nr:hypothetical protein [Myxococcales bacterium]